MSRSATPDPDSASGAGAPRHGHGATPHGLVVASHRRHFSVRLGGGAPLRCVIRGRSLAPACGDTVTVEPTGTGEGVITTIAERSTLFFRADEYRSKVIAANVDQVVGVVAVEPRWGPDLLDRWIVAAEANDCRVLIVLNKVDLPGADAAESELAPLRALGYPVIAVSARRDVGPLVPLLAGARSVLVGQSGMGKSTLINALVPGAAARTGELSRALGAGRHTTTGTILYPLAAGGWLIDSPGMHAFGLAHLSRQQIEAGYREMRPLIGRCRFRDCSHTHEPGCAVREAADRGEVAPGRLESLRRLLAEEGARRGW